MFLGMSHILSKECYRNLEAIVLKWVVLLLFSDVCQEKQMIAFTFLLKCITVEIHLSDLGEEKDAPSL